MLQGGGWDEQYYYRQPFLAKCVLFSIYGNYLHKPTNLKLLGKYTRLREFNDLLNFKIQRDKLSENIINKINFETIRY
jgi:hypothetical protein